MRNSKGHLGIGSEGDYCVLEVLELQSVHEPFSFLSYRGDGVVAVINRLVIFLL